MKHSDTLGKIAPALLAVQAALKPIAKDGTNPHFKSKFATLDGILESVRPVLVEHGLSLLQAGATPHSTDTGAVAAIVVETMLLHTSGEWISSGVVVPIAKHDPQGAGSAVTYGRRYSLSALLALATDEDDDGNHASTSAPAKRREAAPKSASLPLAPDVMPFGKSKGTPLTAMETDKLKSAMEWVLSNPVSERRYPAFLTNAQMELSRRAEAQPA